MEQELSQAAFKARQGFVAGDLAAVEEASMAISGTAKAWQLRALAKIAFLVGQAAGSRDFVAVKDLLPVLCGAVERKIQELRINR